jgi:hypothetical protein
MTLHSTSWIPFEMRTTKSCSYEALWNDPKKRSANLIESVVFGFPFTQLRVATLPYTLSALVHWSHSSRKMGIVEWY